MANSEAVEIGPGLLYVAPYGTPEPDDADDTLDAAFRAVGYTEDGSTFEYEITNEAIEVAEEFDPVKYATTGRRASITFQMAEITRQNLALAMNAGADAAETGDLEPPEPGEEERITIVWDSADADEPERWVLRKCLQAGTVSIRRQKSPNKTLIPVTFRLEKPTGQAPFVILGATGS
ncbi:MAG TPA: hypothetical protein VM345_01925 [Acidimicrobiales bacterium]|nr:hypothetical protein [Acidimicrobiales bacterium]